MNALKIPNIISIPSDFGGNEIREFLQNTEFIFDVRSRGIKNFLLDLSHIEHITIMGQLIIYKFISYTVKNRVFDHPNLSWGQTDRVISIFKAYGFYRLMEAFINKPYDKSGIISSYKNMKPFSSEVLFCVPHSMIRNDYDNRNLLEQNFLNKIADFYDKKKSSIVSLCTSELMLNFWTHATMDADSIAVAKGGDNYFNLYLVDNGVGLLNELRRSDLYENMDDVDLLRSAFLEGVTSKKNTNHQGRGLYIVKELVRLNSGFLQVHTQNYIYRYKNGEETIIKSSYWGGVIMEMYLNLKKPKDLINLGKRELKYKIGVIHDN